MDDDEEPKYWFVGAAKGRVDDRTDELVESGIWRYWPGEKRPEAYRDEILAMSPGDRIAIKSSYVRKRDLPFDNRGHPVSVMAIKAIGTIRENPGNGQHVLVDWEKRFDPPREWYFFTGRSSVWRPKKERWLSEALARFAFDGESQDIERIRNLPFWRERFGTGEGTDSRFAWTSFYEAFADHLLAFEARRGELVEILTRLHSEEGVPHLGYLRDQQLDNPSVLMEDIDPFTFIGAFNRSLTNENRRVVAAALARSIGLEREVPERFDGVPLLNNQKSCFHAWKNDRAGDDINRLWEVFRAALEYADSEGDDAQQVPHERLAALYDEAVQQKGVGWNLTMGLYWIRPYQFAPLDQNTRRLIRSSFPGLLPEGDAYARLTGQRYMELIEELSTAFEAGDAKLSSFPELSLAAWKDEDPTAPPRGTPGGSESVAPPYSIKDILSEGCFFPSDRLELMRERLLRKKNLILQGPPGTGKTWLARKLAQAVIGRADPDRIVALQFHPTLSYEDFVRGWRPGSDGKLALIDGPLMEAVAMARAKPDDRVVIVIEEINRGNTAQILGEMLTLLEADKRSPEHGLRLSYMRADEAPAHLPSNLYLIGTMNIADRSLALVDLALRRRFAFFELEPQLNKTWERWVEGQTGIEASAIADIRERVRVLNIAIEEDPALGRAFRIGHSYVTPRVGVPVEDGRRWFKEIVETEIGPLLEEYWFDRPERAQEETKRLTAGL